MRINGTPRVKRKPEANPNASPSIQLVAKVMTIAITIPKKIPALKKWRLNSR